jgi:hypothetical protein
VRAHLRGRGYTYIREGKNNKTFTNSRFYANTRRTVFGNVSKTPVLNNCGKNAVFGSPWSPDEGALILKVPKHCSELIIRVMDEEWMVKDVVLGELVANIASEVGRDTAEHSLTYQGKPTSGKIMYQMDWLDEPTDTPNSRWLRVNLKKAVGLRSSRMFDTNDVYIEVYAKPDNAVIAPGKALPEPPYQVILPAGKHVLPFTFEIPRTCPTSFVQHHPSFRACYSYVAYSVYSNVDISWQQDPSTRVFFTVLSRPPPFLPAPPKALTQATIHPQCIAIPLCCTSYGTMHIEGCTEKEAYSPGERMKVSLNITSTWSGYLEAIQSVTFEFRQLYRAIGIDAVQHVRDYEIELEKQVSEKKEEKQNVFFHIPSIPASYEGYEGKDKIASDAPSNWHTGEPITWKYVVRAHVRMQVPGILSCMQKDYSVNIPVKIINPNPNTIEGHADPSISSAIASATSVDDVHLDIPGGSGRLKKYIPIQARAEGLEIKDDKEDCVVFMSHYYHHRPNYYFESKNQ